VSARQYKLRNGGDAGVARREMTDDELRSFIRAIAKGKKNEFGLVKMSQLNIDALVPSPPDLPWAARTTLLNYASWMRSDGVSGALLRAGADASIGAQGAVASQDSAAALRTLLPRAAVWTVNQVVAMRAAAAELGARSTADNHEHAPDDAANGSTHLTGAAVKWAECGHVSSEASLWEDLRSTGKLACRCGGWRSTCCKEEPSTLHTTHSPTPYSLHPTLHPTPYTLHSTPYTLHPPFSTLRPEPHTWHAGAGWQ